MKPICLLAALVLIVGASAAADQAEETQCVVEFAFYRIRGDMVGYVTPVEDVVQLRRGDDKAEESRAEVEPRFFVEADMTLAGVRFKADQDAWTWDGEDKPAEGSGIVGKTAPRIFVCWTTPAYLASGATQVDQYFEKRADGLFEAKIKKVETGLQLTVTPELKEDKRITLRDLKMTVTTLVGRKQIEGIDLDVGEPIIEEESLKAELSLKPECFYGVFWRTEHGGTFLIRLRVSEQEPPPQFNGTMGYVPKGTPSNTEE